MEEFEKEVGVFLKVINQLIQLKENQVIQGIKMVIQNVIQENNKILEL